MQLGLDTSVHFLPWAAGVGVPLIAGQSRVQGQLIALGQFTVVKPDFPRKFIELGLHLGEFFGLGLGNSASISALLMEAFYPAGVAAATIVRHQSDVPRVKVYHSCYPR